MDRAPVLGSVRGPAPAAPGAPPASFCAVGWALWRFREPLSFGMGHTILGSQPLAGVRRGARALGAVGGALLGDEIGCRGSSAPCQRLAGGHVDAAVGWCPKSDCARRTNPEGVGLPFALVSLLLSLVGAVVWIIGSVLSCLCPCCVCFSALANFAMGLIKLPIKVIQWFIDQIPC
ncbi:hypothetical protein K1719_034491 [Acacia pycnantha]|nr:hypothetical protein K1719_034491 [Acacia pycnantha]